MQTSGETCREIAKSYPAVIASEAKQSIVPRKQKDGLLRFARNDVGRANEHLPPHPEETAKRAVSKGDRNSYPHQPFNFAIQAMSTFKFLK